MLLLYLHQAMCDFYAEQYLHSTMLLLYPGSIQLAFRPFQNLHSTMLLLYQLGDLIHRRDDLIYIPLCFYFIYRAWSFRPVSGQIYIPLCFYFILSGWCWQATCNHHLHSTMLLLYLNKQIKNINNSLIYIPLCFYFIQSEDNKADPGKVFTFHYASTLSAEAGKAEAAYNKHLHSTMLLLYRSGVPSSFSPC